jgi:hypothetical protein
MAGSASLLASWPPTCHTHFEASLTFQISRQTLPALVYPQTLNMIYLYIFSYLMRDALNILHVELQHRIFALSGLDLRHGLDHRV